jgi:hypothetical protein
MRTLVEARALPERTPGAGDLRQGLATGIRALAATVEALGRAEVKHEAIRRKRYAALLQADISSEAAEQPRDTRRLSLALQGGGAFGAFTWGVLDRLLEENDLEFDAVPVTLVCPLRSGPP